MKTNNLIMFILGAAVGAGLAILFAPDSGENTRKRIKERIDHDLKRPDSE